MFLFRTRVAALAPSSTAKVCTTRGFRILFSIRGGSCVIRISEHDESARSLAFLPLPTLICRTLIRIFSKLLQCCSLNVNRDFNGKMFGKAFHVLNPSTAGCIKCVVRTFTIDAGRFLIFFGTGFKFVTTSTVGAGHPL